LKQSDNLNPTRSTRWNKAVFEVITSSTCKNRFSFGVSAGHKTVRVGLPPSQPTDQLQSANRPANQPIKRWPTNGPTNQAMTDPPTNRPTVVSDLMLSVNTRWERELSWFNAVLPVRL